MAKKALPPLIVDVLERARVIAADGDAVTDAMLVNFVRQAERAMAGLDLRVLAHVPIKGPLFVSFQGGDLEQLCFRKDRDAWRLMVEFGVEGEEPEETGRLVHAGRNAQLAAAASLSTFIETIVSTVAVRILWLPQGEGGRPAPPPGPTYSALARFEAFADRWPEEGWTIVLDIPTPADLKGMMVAGMRALVLDDGPQDLLVRGSRFELWEGRRVARGVVI
jgi:hypothetical protein